MKKIRNKLFCDKCYDYGKINDMIVWKLGGASDFSHRLCLVFHFIIKVLFKMYLTVFFPNVYVNWAHHNYIKSIEILKFFLKLNL